MVTITRVADSCLVVATEHGNTLIDPGGFAFKWEGIDLNDIGDVQRVLITHEHADHVSPEFVRWLVDRGTDVTVHGNNNVVTLLGEAGIEASTSAPAGTSLEDLTHETLPTGQKPPNRSWTVDGALTHPGDTYQSTSTARVLALALLAPWGSMTASVAFARKLGPRMVVPIHDFYLSRSGRTWATGVATKALESAGIELVDLDPGKSFSP